MRVKLADSTLHTRFEVIMTRKPAFEKNRLFRRCWQCILVATLVAGSTVQGSADEPIAQDRPRDVVELVDLDNGARDDPDIIRLSASPPRDWPGPRGPQPYNQVPPGAQQDFARPSPPPSPPPSSSLTRQQQQQQSPQ
jgi:hypothetical protein